MLSKLQILCLMIFCACFGTKKVQNNKQKNIPPRLLIIGSYFSENFGGNVEREHVVLKFFLVNYSDDTLKFWGSNCRPREFFSITNNDYLHLTDEECDNSVFEKMIIPPHRSFLIPFKLLMEKQPREIVRLKVDMKFYKWFASNNFMVDRKNYKPDILTDSIILRYDSKGNFFSTNSDFEEQERKQKLNLPTTKLHLLSFEERKHFTLTADETKIKKVDKEYSYKNRNTFSIPVTLHNNSNKTLSYFSMDCSWQDFYHIDNRNLEVPIPICEENMSIVVKVPPHSMHTVMVPIVFKENKLKQSESFRIGLNININAHNEMFDFNYDELRDFNLVWSNEVHLKTN